MQYRKRIFPDENAPLNQLKVRVKEKVNQYRNGIERRKSEDEEVRWVNSAKESKPCIITEN